MKVLPSIVIALLLISVCSQANASLIFNFSISNNLTDGVPGTIEGRILGLEDNTLNQSASNVFIDSVPAGLENKPNMAFDVMTLASIPANSFSVSNGEITSALFGAQGEQGITSPFFDFTTFVINVGYTNMSFPFINNGVTFTNSFVDFSGNADGLSGVSFTQISAPATLALLGLGLLVLRIRLKA